MTTNTVIDRKAMIAARQNLFPTRDSSWLGGFGNLLVKELGEWFLTRRSIVQTILWLAIIDGFVAFAVFVMPQVGGEDMGELGALPKEIMACSLFYSLAVRLGMIGAIILSQDAIIHEKQSGTAPWILSKPVSRSAFILAKILANVLGVLVFIIAIPGAVAYVEGWLAGGKAAPLLPYLVGSGVVLLGLIFYITLVILLGTLFGQRGPVLGISFGLFFGGIILYGMLPPINYVLPTAIQDIAFSVMQRQPLSGVASSQLILTVVWSILFTIAALWRFQREEF